MVNSAKTEAAAQTIIDRLGRFAPARRYWVAFSGGADSYALLHLLWQHREALPGRVLAVHVDHGLQASAAAWAQHCQRACDALGVPLHILTAQPAPGEDRAGPEDGARRRRMQAFAAHLRLGDALLTAQHQDDQIETVLLNLFRGSGLQGLGGMPAARPLGQGRLLRPALSVPGCALKAIAAAAKYEPVVDPWNEDRRLRRAWLRHELLPRLREGWPGAEDNILRAAQHSREAADALIATAVVDLAGLHNGSGQLRLGAYRELSEFRRLEVLRQWLREGAQRPPGRDRLTAFDQQLMSGSGAPTLAWADGELRVWRDALYRLANRPAFDPERVWVWDGRSTLELEGAGQLRSAETTGAGIAREKLAGRALTVRFRRAGDGLALPGGGKKSLQQVFQDAAVPPWLRARWPLLCADGALVAVAGIRAAAEFAQLEPGAAGLMTEFLPGGQVF